MKTLTLVPAEAMVLIRNPVPAAGRPAPAAAGPRTRGHISQ